MSFQLTVFIHIVELAEEENKKGDVDIYSLPIFCKKCCFMPSHVLMASFVKKLLKSFDFWYWFVGFFVFSSMRPLITIFISILVTCIFTLNSIFGKKLRISFCVHVCGTGDWTQSLSHMRQALYHRDHRATS